jgi:PAS domain S-box-containing protein
MYSPIPLWRSVKARVTLSVLAISLASLWSLSYYASEMLHKDMERVLGKQQFSAVSVVAAQINRMVDSRLNALESIAASLAPTMRGAPATTQARLEQLTLLPSLFNGGVIVYRTDGTAIAEVPVSAGRIGVNYMYIDSVATALKKGRPNVSEPIVGQVLQTPIVGMTVPIRDPQGKIIGALSGLTDLARPNFLDDVTRGAYGTTGGYMLVAPQYRLVITATDKQRIMEKLPAPGSIGLVDQFIQGYEGSGVTRNPQGIEVLASAKSIPVAGWYLATALPTSEAYAPIHDMHRHMVLATILLTLIACALTWWMIRRQLAPLSTAARTLSAFSTETGTAPQSLSISRHDEIGRLFGSFNHLLVTLSEREEALKKNERFKGIILNSMAAHIAVLDQNGVIQTVNEAWLRFAVANGLEPEQPEPHTWTGVNYLTVAHRATGIIPPAHLEEIVGGIQAVLHGKLPAYATEYPCHSVDQKRWFTMNVVPLGREKQEGVVITHTDVTAIKQAEEEQRIAAVAFECQEGMIITDPHRCILRTNQSFSRIMGYGSEESAGRLTDFLYSDRHPPAFYAEAWNTAQRLGVWSAEVWTRHKDGKVFLQWVTCTAVKNRSGAITNYVITHTDISYRKQQEAEQQAAQLAQRDALVREVHHRIKNNLQGITGLLRQFAQAHPEIAAPLSQAISQVRSIAVIHGLQGRRSEHTIRLCELTGAIARDIMTLWQTPVRVDIPTSWMPCVVAEAEAVPMALVLNELIINAVKHGDGRIPGVDIRLRKGERDDQIQICISNTGAWQEPALELTSGPIRNGLQLVEAMLPRTGIQWRREYDSGMIRVWLCIQPPVIHLESASTPDDSDTDAQG